ncbi:cysteine hydrolase family protein [Microbacterium candidum]|uniref:Cysteine hydrolase family protein n=1 Tax=Microbacterium candidum TaxID=3041922 RepID=A0ABT7MVQ6_9MICO|nr:cysteine hydrolase family protein [Microbacterium sp. ASV49]MDL9978547.1 cysteine hydrolase family protein [Microbacterium sp. ASV49]
MTRLLLIIDIQRDYFPGGRYPLVGPDAAADAASRLLAAFRAEGSPVIHVQHVWDAPDAAFFAPGTPGVEIDARVAPEGDEPVLVKAQPNAFLGTELGSRLEEAAPDEVVIVGMMSSMCVDATVRAASDLGYAVTVAHDACAAPDLTFGDESIPGAQVHAAFMAALADSYALVTTVDELI